MKAALWQLFPCQPEPEGSTQQVPRLRGEVTWDTPCPLAHAPCPGRPVRMCSHAAVPGKHGPRGLVPAPSQLPEGHPLPSALAGRPLGAPSRPQLAGLVCEPTGGPKIAAGLAQGWHAERMRDRACPGGSGLSVPARPPRLCGPLLTAEKSQRWMLQGSSQGPRPHPCPLSVEARCSVPAAAAGPPLVPTAVLG